MKRTAERPGGKQLTATGTADRGTVVFNLAGLARAFSAPIGFALAVLSLAGCAESDGGADRADDGLASAGSTLASGGAHVNFESGQVRPLALSADGSRLYATNTPNGTLDILSVTDDGLVLEHAVPVGLEPVAVALFRDDPSDDRGDGHASGHFDSQASGRTSGRSLPPGGYRNGDQTGKQAWVVNHLSDSISVVDLAADPPRVIDTLLVGDEPRDIVFAGPDDSLAFVTTAHRGQNGPDDRPIDAELHTPSVGRADVWVFDARARGESIGGDPTSVVSMFGDTPRALTVSADGDTVYAAVMHSGNRTTAIGENSIAKPGPIQSSDGETQPDTGLILQFDGSNWRDDTNATSDLAGTSYDSQVRFSLPDHDVFAITATETPTVLDRFSGVGTTLFNMAVHPIDGTLYVTNTDANNLTRFEGPGTVATTVRGNLGLNRITLINGNGESDIDRVKPRDLNSHLDRTQPSATDAQRQQSVSQPMGLAVSTDGARLYVASLGTDTIAVYDTAVLADDNLDVSALTQIRLTGGGPTAVVLDDARDRLYAYTRFDNSLDIVDTATNSAIGSVALSNPESRTIIDGRPHLYHATANSSHGDASCASCHVFGDVDAMAWDLGNPDEVVVDNPNRFVNLALTPDERARFHPMKGPMTTQSLRGLADAGPMHWRGDRTGADRAEGQALEHAAFVEFNDAFVALLGRDAPLSDADMSAFADFALTIPYPPNPIRALDNSLTPSEAEGRRIYFEENTTGETFTCNDCHRLDPPNGHFGTDGKSSVEGDDISQEFKVPHLRNAYQKIGKFGHSGRFATNEDRFGDQIKGFGFMHDGNMDTLDNFLRGSVFRFDPDDDIDDRKRRQVVDFVMAMDSDFAPIVGQQITLSATSGADTRARLDLLLARAAVREPRPECDLVAEGVVRGQPRGFLLRGDGVFLSDGEGGVFAVDALLELSREAGGALTFTCLPPDTGAGRVTVR